MSVTSTPPENRVPIIGPGNRGVLPPLSPHASFELRLPDEENPVPGTTEMVELLIRAYGTDVADRVRDALRPAPDEIFHALDIQIPSSAGFHPNEASHPTIEPFTVWEDENVSVRATLVDHPPLAPAYAFRFETSQGSIVVSGDTAPSENLVLLAKDADILLHEAIDFDAISLAYEGVSEQVRNASMDHHRKSHTSASQAAEIANIANVKTLVLHHLVPGNVSRASWKEGAASFRGQLVIAEDLGVLHLGDGTKQ